MADGMARVAFVKSQDRAEGVRKALSLLDLPSFEGKQIFLKPNFNSADPPPGSTADETMRALIEGLRALGAAGIVVGDRSGMGVTREVLEQKGIFRLADELGFEVIALDDLDPEGWQRFRPPGSHWQRGFALARPALAADAIVQTCCLKTHRFGGHFTMSLKNSIGLVAKQIPGDDYDYMFELHTSPDQRKMIAEVNVAYQPALVVLDGVAAFVDGGPESGQLVEPGVVLAGVDRVAIDAVGVAILRYFGTIETLSTGPIFSLAQIARAAELGIGVTGPDQIELVTADPVSLAFAAQIEQILRAG